MKIALDHQAFTMQRFGGVSRYFTELALGLDALEQEVKVFAGFYQNYYLSKIPRRLVSGRYLDGYVKKTGTAFNYLNHFSTQTQIASFAPDVVHETYFDFAKPTKIKGARVITVHDMIHELFPASFKMHDPLSRYKREACRRADHIISVSQNTKTDLIKLFDIPPEEITVIPLGVNRLLVSETRPSEPLTRPFLLYVGDRTQYKNFDLLIKAMSVSTRLKSNFDLVAFGAGEFSSSEKRFHASLGFSGTQIRYVSGSDECLAALYQTAAAFVYPSIYEGFGMPPLEAMSLACPVISSYSSSMPEVIGDAAEYFDPTQQEDLIRAIEDVVFSEERKKDLIQRGKLRLQKYSWANTAARTLEVYRQLS